VKRLQAFEGTQRAPAHNLRVDDAPTHGRQEGSTSGFRTMARRRSAIGRLDVVPGRQHHQF
jgi:hypothetical protein